MKIRFEMKTEFSEKDPQIVIQAAQLTDQVREIMEYLEQFSTTNQVTIPIRTDDYLVMVKIEDLILADIDKNLLTIYTVDGIYKTKETLINFQ
ncbi:MAG: LytTR family transcriptional regulator, partial [Streptococcus mitis]|nr:LytTR family transcriptional regulator [Streptococcus mitis]